jgi:DMSO/TMAO reductase YedYZ molybdopterin-dependent catalytic subunit
MLITKSLNTLVEAHLNRLSRRKFLYAGAGAATVVGIGYLSKYYLPQRPQNTPPTVTPTETSPSPTPTRTQEPTLPEPATTGLPPNQHEIKAILKWNIDHPGIMSPNPKLDLESWKLKIEGEIRDPSTLIWKDFLNLPAIESISDFHCVESWSVRNCKWYGVPFKYLVDSAKPTGDAKYVFFSCADGYTTSLVLGDLLKDNVLLAYRLNDDPLEESLGGPMRLVAPNKYGYKSAMWIQKIRFTKTKELGFWESQGYSYTADVWEDDRFIR